MSTDGGECEQTAIPERLHRKGRPIDPEFADEEWLYCRCRTNGYKGASREATFPLIDEAGLIHEQHVRTQSQSITRDKYSDGPTDALYDGDSGELLDEQAIFGFRFGDVNGRTEPHEQEERRSYEIRVEHVPTPCVYPHSEVRVYQRDRSKADDDVVTEILPKKIKPAKIKLWVIDVIRERAEVFRRFPEESAA